MEIYTVKSDSDGYMGGWTDKVTDIPLQSFGYLIILSFFIQLSAESKIKNLFLFDFIVRRL